MARINVEELHQYWYGPATAFDERARRWEAWHRGHRARLLLWRWLTELGHALIHFAGEHVAPWEASGLGVWYED